MVSPAATPGTLPEPLPAAVPNHFGAYLNSLSKSPQVFSCWLAIKQASNSSHIRHQINQPIKQSKQTCNKRAHKSTTQPNPTQSNPFQSKQKEKKKHHATHGFPCLFHHATLSPEPPSQSPCHSPRHSPRNRGRARPPGAELPGVAAGAGRRRVPHEAPGTARQAALGDRQGAVAEGAHLAA